MRRPRSLLWGLATFVLLDIALAIALSHGRIIEAVIIGVLTIPALLFVIGSARGWTR